MPGYPEFIHRLAFTERPWPQLQELKLFSVYALIEDFTALLQTQKQSPSPQIQLL